MIVGAGRGPSLAGLDFLFWTLEARMALGGEDAYLVLGWLEPISLRFVKNRQLGQLVLEGCV